MATTDQEKWDNRYQNAQQANQAAAVLRDNLHLLPQTGEALELACGLGGNSLLLAARGLSVRALDISPVAISKLQSFAKQQGLAVDAKVTDLSHWQGEPERYDLIVVSAYLDTTLCPAIIRSLKPGGLLCYQTFTRFKVTDSGPSNPAFLLQRGELLSLFADLAPVVYRDEQGLGDHNSGLRNQAYLIAQKPPR